MVFKQLVKLAGIESNAPYITYLTDYNFPTSIFKSVWWVCFFKTLEDNLESPDMAMSALLISWEHNINIWPIMCRMTICHNCVILQYLTRLWAPHPVWTMIPPIITHMKARITCKIQYQWINAATLSWCCLGHSKSYLTLYIITFWLAKACGRADNQGFRTISIAA